MSNTGGAWDNSKKFIKGDGLKDDPIEPCPKFLPNGAKNDKWKTAHENSVTGDTVGDPLKDTSGPSLNILVKLSAITSLVFAGVFNEWSNEEGGPMWLDNVNG